jgi:hypothetical protein
LSGKISRKFEKAIAKLEELRRVAETDLSDEGNFRAFIKVRNGFHQEITDLNSLLYRKCDALLFPELLDDEVTSASAPDGTVRIELIAATQDSAEAFRALIDHLEKIPQDSRFQLLEANIIEP